jgi:hypothetical protein
MTDRIILLWLFLGFLFLAGAYFIFQNYYAWLYLGMVARKERHSSPLPLLGGLLSHLALQGVPNAGVRAWAWVPWILDPGCVFLLGLFLYTAIVTRGFQRAPPK